MNGNAKAKIISSVINAVAVLLAAVITVLMPQMNALRQEKLQAEERYATAQANYEAALKEIEEKNSEISELKRLLNPHSVPGDAVSFGNHAYKAYPESVTWTNAKLYCESVGGHLLSVTDVQESVFISNYVSNLESPKSYYWIGLYADRQRQWFWTTGEPYDYTNWAYNEPNNAGEEYYVHLYGQEAKSSFEGEWNYVGEWNDVAERGSTYNLESFGFICEWESVE